jgi:DNA polymerase I-like protein with 3'-5' exonuclease and polymerase domains
MPIAAVDFESYYDDEVSIQPLGTHGYLQHPKGDIYMVSIVTDTGIEYVGSPFDFDWSLISGPDWTWVSHNASFDLQVFCRTQELAEQSGNTNIPQDLQLKAWECTADLSAFLGVPRSLKEAARYLLGVSLSKDVRDKMKGQRWENMTDDFKEEVKKYALDDSRYCLQIYQQYADRWPLVERKISKLTRDMGVRGVPIDVPSLEQAIENLKTLIWNTRQQIPWAGNKRVDGKEVPLLSIPEIRLECARLGIWAPASFAEKDEEATKWEEEFAGTYPFINAIRTYRKANKHLKTLEAMYRRHRGDGWMPYSLKYAGAHTLRDSGDNGFNVQNIPKVEVCGVDIRSMIKAPEGYKLAIVDLSQIEPRVTHWLAGDTVMLDYIRKIPDLYEAQARAWGMYNEPLDKPLVTTAPAIRHTIKQLSIGLGYGMGVAKFSTVAKVDLKEAGRLTKLYRQKNKKVTALWKKMEKVLRDTASDPNKKHALIPLPSGRHLVYRNVSIDNNGLTAEIQRQGKMLRLGTWGGKIVENLVQAVARDVFMDRCLAIEAAGIPILMRVHDEVVCLVKDEEAEQKLQQIKEIMSTSPSWASDLPVGVSGSLSQVYKK